MHLRLFINIAFCVFSLAAPALGQPPKVISIGFIGPLTGDGASYGTASRNGIELGLKDTADRSKLKIEYVDDFFSPSRTLAAFKRLNENIKVDAVISVGTAGAQAIAPLAQKEHVPLITWAREPRVSTARPYIVRTSPSGHQEGFAIAEEFKRRNYKRVAVTYALNDYARAVYEGFMQPLSPDVIALNTSVVPDDFALTSLTSSLKDTAPASIFICLNPGQSAIVAGKIRDLGLNGPIFGCSTMSSPSDMTNGSRALKDAWYIGIDVDANFRNKYKAEYGNDTEIIVAAIHYDLIRQIAKLNPLELTRENFVEKLYGVPYEPVAIPGSKLVNVVADQYLEIPLRTQTIN